MAKTAKKQSAAIVRSKKPKPSTSTRNGKQGTKSATVLSLLESKSGASISELAKSTGWQAHSVRGFLSGTIKKKLGRKILSEIVDGDRRYRIAG